MNISFTEPDVAERVGRLCLALPSRTFVRLQCACETSEGHQTPTVSSPTHQSHWTPADLNDQHQQRHRKTPDNSGLTLLLCNAGQKKKRW